ncbi:putative lipid II flippase FtsW [Actinomycetospora soli]|uniref:putative lipid II flippase FtsW n=1 Tax=Actinomycetospora soli TaxID=2893887 RepID=UPI001E41A0BB|nr:putative lipid II flippase FtsW [Actinomycetospora soli]MCD2188909.1 putative lipid II flippase FtsW [Actinomycetospora soli]
MTAARSPVAPHVVALRRAVAATLRRPLASYYVVVGLTVVLAGLGLVMVLSASSIDSLTRTGSPYGVFLHQVVYCVVGGVAFWLTGRVPVRQWRVASPWLLGVSLVALVAVLVPGLGSSVAGAQKWFVVGGLSLQPSEPAKLALVLWGAHVLCLGGRSDGRSLAQRGVVGVRRLLPVVPVGVLTAGLVVVEPDLGSALGIVVVLFALLWFAGVSGRLLGLLGAGALAAVGVLAVTASYRLARLTSFLGSGDDSLGAGYQSQQALYSLADGGLLGDGLGQGAAQWSYLPNASNDFVFAILGEELGLVGACAVLGLFALLAWVGLRIAARTVDPWNRVVVATLTVWLVAQAVINIGYVLGLLPVTGITLPLISAGGSSVIVSMISLGLLASAARDEPDARVALRR